jgi:hypothetical protein
VNVPGIAGLERRRLERELALLERRLRAELRTELDARLLELTRYVDGELETIQQRIDSVHTRALRALTAKTGGRPQ